MSSIFRPQFAKLDRKIRQITAHQRCTPDFLIVGAMKAGTTTLHACLKRHPHIHLANNKEVHYFDRHACRGDDWYRQHFPLRHWVPEWHRVGEATPCYLFMPHSAKQIHRLNPDMKIVALLRNPIERAISHYFHNRRKGKEPLGALEAFQQEEARISAAYAQLLETPQKTSWELANYSYKARGRYAEQLERYFALFPASQILLLSTDRLASHPAEVAEDLFRFLDVDPSLAPSDPIRSNVSVNKEPLPEEVRAYLKDCLTPPHQQFVEQYGPLYEFP